MKEILVISEGKNTGNRVIEQLTSLLGEHLAIENILISEIKSKLAEVDLILFTSAYLRKRAIKYIDSKTPSMIAKRVINHKNIADLISIEEGRDVLFVNDSYESTKEGIKQLIELGFDHIRYYEYYPGCNSYPKLEIIITPGELELLPYKSKIAIDIGIRILDIKSIYDLASMLGLDRYLKDSLITDYIRDIIEISKSIEESRRTSYESQEILQTIVNSLEYGVAFTSIQGKIISVNSKFEYIFGLKRKDMIGKLLQDFILEKSFKLDDKNFTLSIIQNKRVLVQVKQVNMSKKIGYIVIVKFQRPQTNLGIKLDNSNNRYIKRNLLNFNDYLTINEDMIKVLEQAKKFAKSDGTILITGENGTGKEILAQAIHMNSYRGKNAFIPINIATLSPNLVESELFGYEEGTFTGAIKGGRLGIFEIANGGTIFIDEIGDVPLDVQAKLLRVLEEKRIRKVGSADEFSVDVRIIAATNKDLLELIKEDRFRLDLFFRINILPLETIPLRMRQEDVEYLLKHFININLDGKQIDSLGDFFEKETINFLKGYQWPGNVRELINLTEYLALIYEDKKVPIPLLHSYMHSKNNENRVFIGRQELWVLEQFSNEPGIPLGRTKIVEYAKKEGKAIGEGSIRGILKRLINMKLIQPYKSLGSTITQLGKETIRTYKE